MNRSVYVAVIVGSALSSFVVGRVSERNAHLSHPGVEGGRKILYYADPMHPEYRSDRPGIAPDCRMKLEPVYATGRAKATQAMKDVPVVSRPATTKQVRGVETAMVETRSGRYTARLLGRVVPDER